MKYSLIEGNIADLKTPCLVTTLKGARSTARQMGATALLKRATIDFQDKLEQTLIVQLDGAVARLVIVGGGDQPLSDDQFRRLCNSAANTLVRLPVKQAVVALDGLKVGRRKSHFKQLGVMRAIKPDWAMWP